MIGVGLVLLASLFGEVGTSIEKYELSKKKESLYAVGFLHVFWITIFMVLYVVYGPGTFVFSLQSLPTFIPRLILEIILTITTIHAILLAERGTFSFLRIITIPLLLAVDLALGYEMTTFQLIGISSIVIALCVLFMNHGLSRKGKMLSLLSALLGVGTVSLYKYDISNFNSVEGEQIVMYAIFIIICGLGARVRIKENVFKYLTKPIFLLQSFTSGLGSMLLSFAFLFAPASILMAVKRSSEIGLSIASGHHYFHEKKPGIKILAFLLIVLGIVFITF